MLAERLASVLDVDYHDDDFDWEVREKRSRRAAGPRCAHEKTLFQSAQHAAVPDCSHMNMIAWYKFFGVGFQRCALCLQRLYTDKSNAPLRSLSTRRAGPSAGGRAPDTPFRGPRAQRERSLDPSGSRRGHRAEQERRRRLPVHRQQPGPGRAAAPPAVGAVPRAQGPLHRAVLQAAEARSGAGSG